MPRVYADGINAYSNIEASKMLEEADYEDAEKKDFVPGVVSTFCSVVRIVRVFQLTFQDPRSLLLGEGVLIVLSVQPLAEGTRFPRDFS